MSFTGGVQVFPGDLKTTSQSSRRRRWPQLFATSNGFARKSWIGVADHAVLFRVSPRLRKKTHGFRCTAPLSEGHFGRCSFILAVLKRQHQAWMIPRNSHYRVMNCMFVCSFSSSAICQPSAIFVILPLWDSSHLLSSYRWKVARKWRSKVMRKTWACHTFFGCTFPVIFDWPTGGHYI